MGRAHIALSTLYTLPNPSLFCSPIYNMNAYVSLGIIHSCYFYFISLELFMYVPV